MTDPYRAFMMDDDPEFHHLVRGWLFPRCEVLGPSGKTLLDAIETLKPELVILDVRNDDPRSLRRWCDIRSDARFASLPVLLLADREEGLEAVRGLESEFTTFLLKPIERRTLLEKALGLLHPRPEPLLRKTRIPMWLHARAY